MNSIYLTLWYMYNQSKTIEDSNSWKMLYTFIFTTDVNAKRWQCEDHAH